jgi:hypothetical protein
MLALTAQQGWFTNTTDIRNAYINTPIDKEVYIQPPNGLEEEG